MFRVVSVLAVAAALVSTSAFASRASGYVQTVNYKDLKGGISLPSCGGSLTLETSWLGFPILRFSNLKDCSNFEINYGAARIWDPSALKLDTNWDKTRSGRVELLVSERSLAASRDLVSVSVKSNSGKHEDEIRIDFYAPAFAEPLFSLASRDYTVGDRVELDHCRGYVDIRKSHDGQSVYLDYNNVRNCDVFDITRVRSSDVDALDYVDSYRAKELNNSGNGSFTLSPKLFRRFSKVTVLFRARDGKPYDAFNVYY